MRRQIFVYAAALAALLVVSAAPLTAQLRVTPGWADPEGSGAERRRTGPSLRLSWDATLRPHLLLRLNGEGLLLRGRPTFPDYGGGAEFADLVAAGASVDLVLRGTGRVRPYASGGLGAYWLQLLGDTPNPYGPVTPALNGALGVDVPLGRLTPFLEARWTLLLTDYAASDFEPLAWRSLSLGLAWRRD